MIHRAKQKPYCFAFFTSETSKVAEEECMQFDYTDYHYRVVCADGCGNLTDWIESRIVAEQVGKNHESETRHKWQVRERMQDE